MLACICMLKQTKIYSFIDPPLNREKLKKIPFRFFVKKSLKNHNKSKQIFVAECSAWRQMKENYQIYLPYQFHWRPQLAL